MATQRNLPPNLPVSNDNPVVTWNWLKKVWTWIQGATNPAISQTTSFTADLTHYYYPCTDGTFVTLPPASSCLGKQYLFKKTNAVVGAGVQISAVGADLIDGVAFRTLTAKYETLGIISDGISTWHVTTYGGSSSPISPAQYNFIINGGMEVAQRATIAAPLVATGFVYGSVDRWKWASTGSNNPSAGTFQQVTSAYAQSGYACQMTGITQAGANAGFAFTQMIESKEATKLVGRTCSAQISVFQNTGSTQTFFLGLYSANAVDNFAAVTLISSVSVSVPSSATTPTTIKLENVAMGACGNGIQFYLNSTVGAMTTKNFTFYDASLTEGYTVPVRYPYALFADEYNRCRRYFQKSFPYPQPPVSNVGNGQGGINYYVTNAGAGVLHAETLRYSPAMITLPTLTFFNPGAAGAAWRNFTAVANSGAGGTPGPGDAGSAISNTQVVGDLVGHQLVIHFIADADF